MGSDRPKVYVVGGGDETLQDLSDLLGGRYVISAGPPSVSQIDGAHASWLLAHLGEGVVLADAGGTVLWANAFFETLDPPTRDRVLQACRTCADVIPGATAGAAPDTPPPSFKFELASADQSEFYDVFVTPSDYRGEQAFAVLVRDVTTHRRTQQKMDAIDRAGYELARFDVEQIRRMNSVERLRFLEQKVVRATRELLRYDHFAIFLLDRDRRRLQLVMSEGLPDTIQDLDLYNDEEGSGISGYVCATGQSYICYDATSDEKYLPGLVGARSSLTVPLRVHDKIIGIMDVESGEAGQFDENDRQFTEIFARHVAVALHMLDLLVAERCEVNERVSDRFEGELAAPLEDLDQEVEWLNSVATKDPEAAAHVARIRADVESIRSRMRAVARGPNTLLGVDNEMSERRIDPVLKGRRILIADDQPRIRKIIGEILGHRGSNVTVCDGGQEAIDRLADAGRDTFDLIISDIQMPDRNGYEVFSAARRVNPDIPVILMTGFGYDPHHSIVRASQEGLQGVLFKPFEVDLLLKQVHEALETEHAAG